MTNEQFVRYMLGEASARYSSMEDLVNKLIRQGVYDQSLAFTYLLAQSKISKDYWQQELKKL